MRCCERLLSVGKECVPHSVHVPQSGHVPYSGCVLQSVSSQQPSQMGRNADSRQIIIGMFMFEILVYKSRPKPNCHSNRQAALRTSGHILVARKPRWSSACLSKPLSMPWSARTSEWSSMPSTSTTVRTYRYGRTGPDERPYGCP